MASLDFIYDLRDFYRKKKKDSLIFSMQAGRKNVLKIDVITDFDEPHTVCMLMEIIPQMSQDLKINKNYKLCPKEVEFLCKGLSKQQNFYLVITAKHSKVSCNLEMFYYLPNRGLVDCAKEILSDFYKSVENDIKHGEEDAPF